MESHAQYFAYHFDEGETRVVYAFSEKEARDKYEELFGEPSEVVFKRENW